jgi:tetratricopeptide (TPR) repeat protein
MTRAGHSTLALVAALATLVCEGGERPGPELERLPEVEIAGLDPGVREEYEARSRALRHALAEREAHPDRLAEAFGDLGMWHHVYRRLAAAAAAYRNAERLQPRDSRWPYYLADVRRLEGDFDAARRAYQRAIALRPGYLPAFVRLAEIEIEAGRVEAARELLERARSLDPEHPRVLALLGRAALLERDFEAAEALLARALAADPGREEIHYLLASAYRGRGDLAQAQRHLEASRGGYKQLRTWGYPDPLMSELDRVGQSANFRENRAYRALLEGRLEEGIAHLRAAVAANPSDLDAKLNLGAVLLSAGETDEATGIFEEITRRDRAGPPAAVARAHVQLAGMLDSAGRPGDAQRHYERALEVVPGQPDATRGIARLLVRRGRPQAALTHFDAAIQEDPADVGLRLERALALMALGEWQRARRRLEADVGDLPTSPLPRLALARLLAASPDPATRDADRSLALATELNSARSTFATVETLAMAQAEAGRLDRAVALQQFAIDGSGGASGADAAWRQRRLDRYRSGLPCREPFADGELARLLGAPDQPSRSAGPSGS